MFKMKQYTDIDLSILNFSGKNQLGPHPGIQTLQEELSN